MSSQQKGEDTQSIQKQTFALEEINVAHAEVKLSQPENNTDLPKDELSQTHDSPYQQKNETEKQFIQLKNESADENASLFQPQNQHAQTKNDPSQSDGKPPQQHDEHFDPDDDLLRREYKLVQQLKDVCDDSGKEINSSKSATIIHELGLIYRQRSPDKFSLIKSAGLLNAAIIRKPPNVSEIKQGLADLCKHILQQAEAADQTADLIEKADEVKSSFNQLRDEVDQFLSNSKSTENKVSNESAQNQLTVNFEENKISNIQFIQAKITDTYMKTMANLCQYCENVMGKPPCYYTVMGMGSLARKEATPYSDFEHMITLEEPSYTPQHLDYFRWFTLIFHIVILNVQETIIPALHIPSLNDKNSKPGDWFFDSRTRDSHSHSHTHPWMG